jgi:predicted deacylase
MAAAFRRSMQLSPIDQREVHYQRPNASGSYSEHLIELLLGTIGHVDALMDLHGGEVIQDVLPHIHIPWTGDESLWNRGFEIARAFDVPYISRRKVLDTPLVLPSLLLEAGIPNFWTEIGRNGLPQETAIALQYEGILNALRVTGNVAGQPKLRNPQVIGPDQWSILCKKTGLWRPAVHPGQHVKTGQLLGEVFDVFGARIDEYRAPGDGIVMWVCTSPPVDTEWRPHGNSWHQWLMTIIGE